MNQPLVADRYRLLERIATGGSAEVWRALDEQLGREVAVKRLHAHLLPDEASRKRLVAEARSAAGLSHPVIVAIYDVDAARDRPALVMEFVDGESLASRVERDGPLPPREAASIAADLAEGLYHAHQQGVVHRDVKPANVLLARGGRTRLVDFGIAHSLAKSAERLTLTGTVIGTLSAMAPEQLASGPITPRTDLYGLGVVLHYALLARNPYAAASPVALADAQRAGPPALESIEPALGAVIAGCMAYEPARRPVHAGAVAAALRDWIAGRASAALAMAPKERGPSADTTALRPASSSVADPAPVAVEPPRSSRGPGRRLLGLAGLAAGALLIAIVAAFVSNDPDGGGALSTAPTSTVSPAQATPELTPSPSPTPAPALAGWAADLAKKHLEDCGTELDPSVIAGMDKKAAEDEVKRITQECKREDGD